MATEKGAAILCGLQPDPRPEDKPQTEDGKCPKCGAETVRGYGMAAGGMGTYEFCGGDCDYFVAHQDEGANGRAE